MHQLSANWCARNFRMRFGETGRAFLEAKHDRAYHSRSRSVGLSRNGIRFVNKCSNAAYAPGQHRRSGSEPAHAEDHLGLEFPIDGSAKRQAFIKTPEETKERW